MKIAILMHGITGATDKFGTGNPVPLKLSHDHFCKHILEANKEHDIDIFAHSWSIEDKDEILCLYEPKKHLIEPQIIFDFEYTVGDPNKTGGAFNRADFGEYYGKYRGTDNLRFHSMFSRWYSAKTANDLKKQYEDENNIKYDFVFLTRYDLAYIVDIKFSDYNNQNFYVIGPDSPNGYNDLWFFSDTIKMDTFCKMFDWIKSIHRFPNKHIGNHFLSKEFIQLTRMKQYVKFIFNRPWNSHQTKKDLANGLDVGPSPPVRRWYDLEKITPFEDMNVLRERIHKTSEKKISD